jgi:hypothetical protein
MVDLANLTRCCRIPFSHLTLVMQMLSRAVTSAHGPMQRTKRQPQVTAGRSTVLAADASTVSASDAGMRSTHPRPRKIAMGKRSSRSSGKTATIHDPMLKRGDGGEPHKIAERDVPVPTTAQRPSSAFQPWQTATGRPILLATCAASPSSSTGVTPTQHQGHLIRQSTWKRHSSCRMPGYAPFQRYHG